MADEREPFDARQVGTVINVLSEQHASRVAARDARRAWQHIQSALGQRASATRRAWSGRAFVSAAGVVLAVAALFVWSASGDSQLRYELRGGSARGGLIEAARGEVTVSLSDGSAILAENQSRFSVDVVGKSSALTRLVSGKLHVRVEHQRDTSYRFIAGPYEVKVVGTEFDLSWEPERDGLLLAMTSGQVSLREPSGRVHTLRAPHSLRLPAVGATLATNVGAAAALARPGAAPPAAPTTPSALPAAAPTTPRGPARLRELSAPAGARDAALAWDAMVAKGQFAEVVREARAQGLEAAVAGRGPRELKALGQAARYVGERRLALRSFSALRQRNRGTEWAQQAAFFLARLYEEQGSQAEALRWLGTYLTEAPRGVYAAEAQGRRLALTQRVRGTAVAQPLAREYLERFPEGAYARLARGITEQR